MHTVHRPRSTDMCGIAGILNLTCDKPPDEEVMRLMLGRIRHRGPDQFGMYLDHHAALGNARLSILDLTAGQQPISNEDDRYWIVYNGEIYNFPELRADLEKKGHRFKTHTDTEVLLHAYEEEGPACLGKLNGQFALAIWDRKEQALFLARDRCGVRPLFYTQTGGALIFGSEIKALLADPRVRAEIDPVVLDQIFTYWCPVSPGTVFKGIQQLPPGHYMMVRNGEMRIESYWELEFPEPDSTRTPSVAGSSLESYLEEFESLLVDATKVRLRADVPVGAYLSGGLDSSTIATIIKRFTTNRLDTFSIAFSDPRFDESVYQREMAKFLGTDHRVVHASHEEIGRAFPEVIWHAEAPVTRTAPAPMFLLSKLVRDCHYKVVLTGEGADEFLGGYDIFKEDRIRRFWARRPDSPWRSMLLRRLYGDIQSVSKTNTAFLTAFFRDGLSDTDSPFYSHWIRWRNNRRTRRFFSKAMQDTLPAGGEAWRPELPVPDGFKRWGNLERAQYWEITLFLSQYLLCSQGDRMGMAHSVEGRFPFLDHRVIAFANRLPSSLKLRGLTEKFLLKKLASRWLPESIWRRNKRPYRAPIHRSFFTSPKLNYVEELLSEKEIKKADLFRFEPVRALRGKVESGKPLGETDDMALVGILSTQLVWHQFVDAPRSCQAIRDDRDDVKVCRG